MKSDSESKVCLDRAIRASRDGDVERLSGTARQAVLRRATAAREPLRPLRRLFLPWGQMALAGALPVLLAAVTALAWVSGIPRKAPHVVDSRIEVSKVGDQVVFTIANGRTDHQVVKSARPDEFDPAGAAPVSDGSFSDALHSGADLVFYRID